MLKLLTIISMCAIMDLCTLMSGVANWLPTGAKIVQIGLTRREKIYGRNKERWPKGCRNQQIEVR